MACARQGIYFSGSHFIGRGEQGFVVAEEHHLGALLRHVPFGLVEIEDVQAEVAVVVAAVAPVHVYKTILVQPVNDKGMPLHAHRIGGVQYGTACAQFAFNERPPVVRRIFITIHVAHILPAHHPLQRVNKPTDICAALARSPVHVAGHAEPVRQACHSVGLLLGVGSLVVLWQDLARVHRFPWQDVGHGIVVGFPALEGVAQGHCALMVRHHLLHRRSYAAHHAPLVGPFPLVVAIVGAMAVEGVLLVAHHLSQEGRNGHVMRGSRQCVPLTAGQALAEGSHRLGHLVRGGATISQHFGQAVVGGHDDKFAIAGAEDVTPSVGSAQLEVGTVQPRTPKALGAETVARRDAINGRGHDREGKKEKEEEKGKNGWLHQYAIQSKSELLPIIYIRSNG